VTERDAPPGTLYVVGTPIGNLEDLSFRAVARLGGCAVIACEDTRRTRILLGRHGLKTRLVSCHMFNEPERADDLLAILRRGEDVALVTDGGTPGISDPGALLVRRVREGGCRVVPVPGASALTALLSVSGFPSGPFLFVGFLPQRGGERRREIEALRDEVRPLLFFEAPHRLEAMLDDAVAILGDRETFLGREMTKLHEDYLAGTLRTIRETFRTRAPRGEIALLVAGAAAGRVVRPGPGAGFAEGASGAAGPSAAEEVERMIGSGVERREALRRVARQRGLSRSELYRQVAARRGAAKR
jgi:16S rRNA (cytidine1402-2'-O)-methyltransferase